MPGRPIHAVVFDMDGTLLDSLPVVLECYRRTIVELDGPELSHDQVLSSFSIGSAAAMLEALIGRAIGQEAVARYEEHLVAAVGRIAPYPGVAQMLEALSDTMPIGVFTAADTGAAEILLGAGHLRSLIGPVIGGDRVARPKPAPDGVLAVCEALGRSPRTVAYVGDGPADVDAARACGALAVAAAWGHLYRRGRDADVTVWSPRRLVDLVGSPRSVIGRAR